MKILPQVVFENYSSPSSPSRLKQRCLSCFVNAVLHGTFNKNFSTLFKPVWRGREKVEKVWQNGEEGKLATGRQHYTTGVKG